MEDRKTVRRHEHYRENRERIRAQQREYYQRTRQERLAKKRLTYLTGVNIDENTLYICKVCRVFQPSSQYHKNKGFSKGHASICRACKNQQCKDKHRDRSRLEEKLFYRVRVRCLKLERYKSFMPKYTLVEFREFCATQPLDKLYNDWKESGFSRALAPSVDRIDNDRGYELDNIEIVTTGENSRRGNRSR